MDWEKPLQEMQDVTKKKGQKMIEMERERKERSKRDRKKGKEDTQRLKRASDRPEIKKVLEVFLRVLTNHPSLEKIDELHFEILRWPVKIEVNILPTSPLHDRDYILVQSYGGYCYNYGDDLTDYNYRESPKYSTEIPLGILTKEKLAKTLVDSYMA